MKKILASAAALTVLAAAAPAFAQAGPTNSTTANAAATIVTPITITNVDGITFGTIAAGVGGTVTVDATTGALSSSNPNMLVGAPQAGDHRATFNVAGQATLAYTATVAPNVTLNSGANQMTATLAGGGSDTLDNAGADSFDVSGVLTVAPAQAPGIYNGTFSASVQYN